MEEESNLEKIVGSLPTAVAGTLLAVFSSTPIAALLPVLNSSLASRRQKERVENALCVISSDLDKIKDKLIELSDPQYKLINETILAIFHTIEENKLSFLRNVVTNTVNVDVFGDQEAALLSRLVRDLSADEAKFLIDYQSTSRFMLSENRPSDNDALHIVPESDLGLIASGLVSLGLLVSAEPTWDDTGRRRFSPIVEKLVSLIEDIDA
jgi:hypothetical protein